MQKDEMKSEQPIAVKENIIVVLKGAQLIVQKVWTNGRSIGIRKLDWLINLKKKLEKPNNLQKFVFFVHFAQSCLTTFDMNRQQY